LIKTFKKIYQIDSRLCIEHFDKLLVEDLNKDKNQVPEDKANIGASGKKDFFFPQNSLCTILKM